MPPDPHPTTPPGQSAGSAGFLARLRDWFDSLDDIAPGRRVAWIEAHVGDTEERDALLRLLESDANTSGFFEIPAADHLAGLPDDEAAAHESLIGTRVGAFRLVRLLGRGGMAAVFLGEREGGDFRQLAAVKLLRRGLYSELEQRLFQRERQVLASLAHPNIAHLIDGGVTAAGVPFLAMEYVDGATLLEHAAARGLDARARIALMIVVCRAVEVAHRNLVVHRDIKPSNIMVTHDGMVKLLDFGIAKLVEDEADATTSVIFTPEYAAPEQRSGQAVTTATDVHALGIVLHELLLGTRPAGSPTQRPSARIDAPRGASEPATLRRLLRGDLDNVLLRALEAEPERRYASAGAFADDLQRHLDGQPVAAHPPSRVYRARKFVARHRGGVLVVASLVLAVLASLVVAVWQMNVARREAQRAEAESRRAGAQAARAEHVKEFLLGLFRGLDPDIAPERRPTLARIFEDGIGGLRSDASIDARLRTELLTIAGDVLFRSGERQRGLDLVGEAVASAQAQLPADAEESLKAIATLSDLDFLDSRVDVARSRLLAAIERAGTGASAGRIALLVELGLVERRRGDLAAAVDRLEQAAAMRTAAAVAADSTLGVLVDTELAYLYYLSARFSDAARLQQPLLARLRARHGDDHAPAMRLMGDYADTLARIGRDREAVDLLLASGRFMRRTQPAPNETLGVWLDSLGTAYLDQGLLQPAARAYAESVATLTARFGADDIQVLGSRAA
ncbi:MAG: serine/threonine protein kinase, partial [Xanthomonadales bacterium]|nr:serine/threonine protein kinase [Xanthomonadales bacterium]